jgi:small GTP-binding protein
VPDATLALARLNLRRILTHYGRQDQSPSPDRLELQAALKPQVDHLSAVLDKLENTLVRIAVFGLVSRGKSAVLNALMGQKLLPIGAIHGVTQWPRSVCWALQTVHGVMQVELIDTPGLDEVDGQSRADLAREVAEQADLILFVVAGEMTRLEYEAIAHFKTMHKPLLLVMNKIDLYPRPDRQAFCQRLNSRLAEQARLLNGAESDIPAFQPTDVVMVAADPAPREVRVEWPDGRVTQEWETPLPDMADLTQTLLDLLNREGASLLAVNAMRQAQVQEVAIAQKIVQHKVADAKALLQGFVIVKALVIGLNPVAVLDLLGGAIADLILIRSLARLYGLPMTRYGASHLLDTLLWSSGGLLLAEVAGGLLFGMEQGMSLLNGAGVTAWISAAIAQGTLAAYGSYRVSKAAQSYLEQGSAWGPQGTATLLQTLMKQSGVARPTQNL